MCFMVTSNYGRMKIVRCIGYVVLLAYALSSCDSREDWFQNYSELYVAVTIDGTDCIVLSDGLNEVEVDAHVVDAGSGFLYTDTCELVFKGFLENREVPLRGFSVHRTMLIYKSPITKGSFYRAKDDTSAVKISTELKDYLIEDVLGHEKTVRVVCNIWGDVPPAPVLKVTRISSGLYEYNLSLADSFDKDGTVQKYEWCVDGNVVPYSIQDDRYESQEGDWQGGKAAYGGTYIKATSLDNVNHSFQTPGNHIVYYRCMDNVGVWSMWYSQIVTVE